MKAEYRNSKNTKKKISSAYLTLINSKKKFSVTDLVNLAKVNRGTFYLHFKSLKDVERYIEEEVGSHFKGMEVDFRQTDISINPEIIFEKLNEILLSDLDYFKLIIGAGDNIKLMDKIKHFIMTAISNNFEVMKYVTDLNSFKLVVQFIVGGTLDCYTQWFKGNLDCELNDLSVFLTKLIKEGLKGCIKYAN